MMLDGSHSVEGGMSAALKSWQLMDMIPAYQAYYHFICLFINQGSVRSMVVVEVDILKITTNRKLFHTIMLS